VDRQRISGLIRGWAPVVIGVVVGLAILGPVQRTPTILRFEPLAFIGLMAIFCFSGMARTDRLAFASLFIPATLIALSSLLLPQPAGYAVGMVPWVGLTLFLFVAPVRVWWWRVVLRRRPATARQRFARELHLEAFAWTTGLQRERPDLPPPDAGLAAADAAVERMAALAAPDPEASEIRDAAVAIARRWIAFARRHDPDEDATLLSEELERSRLATAALRER
jgi:hypothetical protein